MLKQLFGIVISAIYFQTIVPAEQFFKKSIGKKKFQNIFKDCSGISKKKYHSNFRSKALRKKVVLKHYESLERIYPKINLELLLKNIKIKFGKFGKIYIYVILIQRSFGKYPLKFSKFCLKIFLLQNYSFCLLYSL